MSKEADSFSQTDSSQNNPNVQDSCFEMYHQLIAASIKANPSSLASQDSYLTTYFDILEETFIPTPHPSTATPHSVCYQLVDEDTQQIIQTIRVGQNLRNNLKRRRVRENRRQRQLTTSSVL